MFAAPRYEVLGRYIYPKLYASNHIIYGHPIEQSMDQPGKGANPSRGQLVWKMFFSLGPRSRLRVWSCETGSSVHPAPACLFSILRLNLVLTHGISPYFRDEILLFFYVAIQHRVSPECIGSRPSLTIVCYYGKYLPVLEFRLGRSRSFACSTVVWGLAYRWIIEISRRGSTFARIFGKDVCSRRYCSISS